MVTIYPFMYNIKRSFNNSVRLILDYIALLTIQSCIVLLISNIKTLYQASVAGAFACITWQYFLTDVKCFLNILNNNKKCWWDVKEILLKLTKTVKPLCSLLKLPFWRRLFRFEIVFVELFYSSTNECFSRGWLSGCMYNLKAKIPIFTKLA